MPTNMGVIDRVLRLVPGLLLLGWVEGHWGPDLSPVLSWAVYLPGLFLSLTGLFRFCPFYALLDMDSCAVDMR